MIYRSEIACIACTYFMHAWMRVAVDIM